MTDETPRTKTFPCWVCGGRGGWEESFGDIGTKWDNCSWCDDGLITVRSEKHVRLSLSAVATAKVVYKFAPPPAFYFDAQEEGVDERERELLYAVMGALERLWRYQCGLPMTDETPSEALTDKEAKNV